jgi:transcriptional regulator with XRE-family HTH domain
MSAPTPIEKELAALGRVIRQERERKGMTPAQLAEAAGVERERLAALEAGRDRAPASLLFAVAGGLNARLGVLMARAEGLDLGVGAMLARHGERRLTPEEFAEHLGHLPTDGEG